MVRGMKIGGAIAIGAGAFGYAIGVGVDVHRKAAWWEIVTALGTLAAVVSAIWMAFWTNKQSGKAAKVDGALEAVSASQSLMGACGFSQSIVESLEKLLKEMDEIESRIAQLESEELLSSEVQVLSHLEYNYKLANDERRRAEQRTQGEKLRLLDQECLEIAAPVLSRIRVLIGDISHSRLAAFNPGLGLDVLKAKANLGTAERWVRNLDARLCVVSMQALTSNLVRACKHLPSAERFVRESAVR